MSKLKVNLSNFDLRRRVVEERVGVLKAKVKAAHLEVNKAIKEYKKTEDFKLEVVEVCINFYHLEFSDCKKKVALAFFYLDLKDIVESNEEGEEEEDSEGEGASKGVEEPNEVGVGQGCAYTALGVVAEKELWRELLLWL